MSVCCNGTTKLLTKNTRITKCVVYYYYIKDLCATQIKPFKPPAVQVVLNSSNQNDERRKAPNYSSPGACSLQPTQEFLLHSAHLLEICKLADELLGLFLEICRTLEHLLLY
ncbi:unnamed protein product [Urochloa humidicola]